MSIYHSMSSSGQANNTNNSSNGQSSDSNAKNDLTMDYLASIYASNGTLPPSMLQQQSATNSMTQNSATGDIMNAILTAAVAAASPSAPTMDPFTASTLLTSIMYSQQQQQQAQQNSLLQSNARQAQVDPYASKANLPIDPAHFAQHALLQAGIEASNRQQHQQNNHQHQMALVMANLLGQCTSNPLLALHQRRDLYGEEASTSSSTAGTDESFSSVLAKLTQGLNQSAASGTASSRTPVTSQGKTKGIPVHTSSGSSGTSRYSSQQTVTDATTAVYAAAALSVLQQQQNRLTTTPKHQSSLTVPSRPTTASSSTPQRDGQLHRGRGRPPKSSISVTKIQVDKQSRASTSTPQSESSIADSNSIDGTITDVLKRFNDSTDQAVPRKRKRVDSVEKSVPNSVSAPAASSNMPNIPASSTKTDTLSHKRARTLPENGYRLPLNLGWRRETLVKGVGPGGLLGDVVYIAPCGRQFWNIDNIREYLRSTANTMLTTEDFTFKSYIRLGDYYECNKESEQGFVKMSDSAVNALIATGQETQSGGHRRKPQPVYPSNTQALTPAVSTGSNTKASLGENSNAEMMAALGGMNPEACAKTFTELALGLQRFPPQMSSTLVNQIGSVWTPWPVGLQGAAVSSSSSNSCFQFPSSQGNHQQHQQPKERPSYPALTNSIDDFNDIRAFFKKLVEDLQRLESEKESLRKADLEAQNAKARGERITYLVEEELRRPVEDLNLLNPKPLPNFDPIEGNRMPSQVFTDCVFVLEFLHAFTEVLCIDPESIPSMRCLQAAFIERDETCLEVVNHLIIELLKFAILDPGIPTPRLVTQILNARFSEMEVNTHTVTGLLRVLLIGRNSYEDEMSDWLAPSNVDHIIELSGPQIASLLAFICDELACSSRIISNEVDRTIELQIALKRDKFNLEAKIRRIRVILARKFGLDHTIKPKGFEGEKNRRQPAFLHNIRQLSSLQNYDSGDEEELESADELEKRIESLQQCLEAKQRAIEECAFRLSGVFLGQDRFHRNYFVMGSVGGIYVEGQPTSNRMGFASHGIPAVFDADAIVAEIKARRELSVTRHFNTNPGNSSNTSSVTQKFAGIRSAALKVEKLTSEKNKEPEVKPEETFEVKSEQYGENPIEIEEPKVKKLLDETNKVNEDRCEPNEDKTDIEAKEPSESSREDISLKDEGEKLTLKTLRDSEEKAVQKMDDSEEPSTSQPLDLSTKRPTPPPPSPPPQPQLKTPTPVPSPVPPMSDQNLWQSLTEQDVSCALEACQMDDTFITTATLLFITQNDLIDRASIINCWSDPSWHMQLFFYKLQLMKSIAFEKKKSCDENNSLTQSLKRLKTLLDESNRENRGDICHQVAKDIQLNEEELITVVEEMLEEKGIQKAGPEDLGSIPQEAKGNWWRVRGSQNLQKLLAALHSRGIRERNLLQIIQTAEDTVISSIDADASTVLDIESISSDDGWKPSLLRVRSRRGKGRGVNASTSSFLSSANTGVSSSVNLPVLSHSTRHIPSLPNLYEAASELDACTFRGDNDASSTFTLERSVFLGENFERAMRAGRGSNTTQQSEAEQEFVDECRFLELVEGLVDRVLSASLQTKGWQAPMKATEDDSIQLVPRNSPKIYRYDFWPLELARERLLDLEAHTERRYLLPPLNCESRLDAVQAQAAVATQDERQAADKMKIADGTGSVCSDSTNQDESHTRNRGDANNETESGIDSDAQGLTLWRRNTRKADSIVELKRCAMQFEAAIAWDKSIMKVLCQICRRDKNEARLLLCDGCDHGFHTYCFRPPMISIPEGDWFCYDCVSKAMGKCHCFVCGLTRPIGENSSEGAPSNNVAPAHRLVQCVSCSRGAHPACLRPPVNRLPKKWTCMLCTTNGVHVGSREKSGTMVATTSAIFSESDAKMSQANSIQLDRPKRVYIKSGTYRSTKRIARIAKPDSTKVRTASSSSTSERKVGRPKGSKRGLKKRGRPSSQCKRPRTDADTVDPNDTSADEDEEVTDGEDQDEDGAERKGEGGDTVDKDEAIEGSEGEENGGGDEEEQADDSTNNGVIKSNKNLSPGIPSTVVVIRRPRKNRKKRLNGTDREFCRNATEDLMKHELSWPFRKPVCCKTVPIYRRIIKRPMDLSTILKRLVSEKSHHYSSLREWREDVRQIFTNCRIFNEDESEIGKAGHELRKYFESTWATISQERSPASAAAAAEMPTREESIITVPSSPESPNSSAKPASEVDDVPSISPAEASAIPPLSSMEFEDAPPSPNSKEPTANEEEEQKTESPCAGETAVESVSN